MAKQTFFGPPEKDWSERATSARALGFNLLRDFEPMMHELYPESRAYNFGFYSEDDVNNQMTFGWRFMTGDMFDVENFDATVGTRFGIRLDVHNRVMHGNNYIMLMSKSYRDDVILPERLQAIRNVEAAADEESVIVHPEDPEYNKMKDAGREIARSEKTKVQVRGTPDHNDAKEEPADKW